MSQPSVTRRFGRILLYVVLSALAVITLLPFLWMACSSVKIESDFFTSQFLPHGDGFLGVAWERLTAKQFIRLFTDFPIGRSLLNSIFLSSVISVLATILCAAGGYALAKFHFRGRTVLTTAILSTVVLPASLLLSPGFETLYHLGLVDTYAGMIIPAIAPAFGLYLFRQAMLNSLPNELLESARIDGAGEVRIFFQIVLPIVRPMMSAYLIIMFIATWNNFITPQIVLQSPERHPLSVAIFGLKGIYGGEYNLMSACTLVSIAPVMILFLLLQKEFISGLTSGAVKG